jgi:hypothetical protein
MKFRSKWSGGPKSKLGSRDKRGTKQCHTTRPYLASVSRPKTLQKLCHYHHIQIYYTMSFLSTTFIRFFLILFVASYIAIAGPVPDVVGNDLSIEGREQASDRSESSSRQAAGGDFLLSGDFVDPLGTR